MSATKKESLEDILNAVREKEDVLKPLPGEEKKKPKKEEPKDIAEEIKLEEKTEEKTFTPTIAKVSVKTERELFKTNKNIEKMARYFASPLRYFALKFFAGIFFGLGIAVAALVILYFLYMHKDVRIIQELFGNMILMMKAMAR